MMATSTNVPSFEDSYEGEMLPDFGALMRLFETLCEDSLYGPWNVPVWIDREDLDDGLFFVHLGLMLTRHGTTTQWVAPATNEQIAELESRMLRVWAGRAEQRFARHTWSE